MESIRRGDVVLVDFDPTRGSEVKKSRPAVVVSNDMNNQYSPLLTVVPLSSKVERVYPFEVLLQKSAGLAMDSKAVANQIRTVSKDRVIRKLTTLSPAEMAAIEKAILVQLGMSGYSKG